MRKTIIIMMIIAVSSLFAADMVINKTDGTEIIVPLDSIEDITFMTQPWNMVEMEGIALEWMVEGAYLHAKVTAPTTGWVSVGFDPTNQMANANIIIGYVDMDVLHLRDDFGTSATSHASDESLGGVENTMQAMGEEMADMTTIQFKIPLDSGDEYDRVLMPGNTYTVILAYGNSDGFTGMHALATSVEIEL